MLMPLSSDTRYWRISDGILIRRRNGVFDHYSRRLLPGEAGASTEVVAVPIILFSFAALLIEG